MKYPEYITFKLVDKVTKAPVSNIAVSLILYAHRKNNYYVGPKITNNEGLVILKKEECLKEIKSSKEFYLMDYFSTLEQCLAKVSIEIDSIEQIEIGLKKTREFRDIYKDYWDCSEEYLKTLEKVDNDKYISKIYDFTENEVNEKKILVIELEKKTQVKPTK
ncbi:MAG: hypothetical protein ABIH71_05630 [Candidatus Omnitrophota bacterium]